MKIQKYFPVLVDAMYQMKKGFPRQSAESLSSCVVPPGHDPGTP